MSVANWFESFNQNLRMSTETVADIAYCYKRITKQLNKDFYNSDSDIYRRFYAGAEKNSMKQETTNHMIMPFWSTYRAKN